MPKPRRRIKPVPSYERRTRPPVWLWLGLVLAAGLLVLPLLLLPRLKEPLAQHLGREAAVEQADGTNRSRQVPGRTLTGRVRVIDGDTLRLGEIRIRLHGIDAPETDQICQADGLNWPCGRMAAQELRRMIGTDAVDCQALGQDRYGRILARCYVDGRDLQAKMVAEGWATAYSRYSKDYEPQEVRARSIRIGMWKGDAVAPEAWRRRH